MSLPLTAFARRFILDPPARESPDHPVLVWASALVAGPEQVPDLTNPGVGQARPRLGEPLVFEVKKGTQAMNALALGITIGRTANNDVCIPEDSVSRFHGYFEKNATTGLWSLVDVGSMNGTVVSGIKLTPKKPHVLGSREQLMIGKVALLFLAPEAFIAYVDEMLKA
ncbi:MAG: FHA domain-containing protein [Myxococcaceae bacterium]